MNKNCKKCGHPDIDTQYVDEEDSEYLDMTCKNCGYEWEEVTLDNLKVEPIVEEEVVEEELEINEE